MPLEQLCVGWAVSQGYICSGEDGKTSLMRLFQAILVGVSQRAITEWYQLVRILYCDLGTHTSSLPYCVLCAHTVFALGISQGQAQLGETFSSPRVPGDTTLTSPCLSSLIVNSSKINDRMDIFCFLLHTVL